MVPSSERCLQLMEQYGMPENIKAHSMVVARVARLITLRLDDAGIPVCLEKVIAGALMHDIGKALCLQSGDDHATKGEQICQRNRLDEIAEIVGEHVHLNSFHPCERVSEKEIVYYADKRVNDDRVVSLRERRDYIIERYAKKEEGLSRLIRENFRLCMEVEKKLFSKLDFRPEDLKGLIHEVSYEI